MLNQKNLKMFLATYKLEQLYVEINLAYYNLSNMCNNVP